MSEREYSPEHEDQPELNDAALMVLLADAIRLFDSTEPTEQHYLEEKLLPVLSDQFGTDLLLSSNTRGFLEDKMDQLQASE